mgnify:FL=1
MTMPTSRLSLPKITNMTTAKLKNDLHRMVVETDDPKLLRMMAEWFEVVREEKDWWQEISDKERQLILEGRKQLAEGKGIPHSMVRAKVRKLFKHLQNQ